MLVPCGLPNRCRWGDGEVQVAGDQHGPKVLAVG